MILALAYTGINVPSVSGADLRQVLQSKSIDQSKVQEKWGYMHRAILYLNVDERNWIGGDSTLIYKQNTLTGWSLEEKRLLSFLLLLSFPFQDPEIKAIATMLGDESNAIARQLDAISDKQVMSALSRGVGSQFVDGSTRNYRAGVRRLVKATDRK